MKLPELDKPDRYTGLYVFDFGDHAGVGFTAEEVAELLESERYQEGKVYKIYRAYPDGRVELKGVPAETFLLESGMVFYATTLESARDDFKRLVEAAVEGAPPCRAKVHLVRYEADRHAVVLIYPAEYEDEASAWLSAQAYQTAGPAEGGAGAMERYYRDAPEILDRHQLFGAGRHVSRTGEELLVSLRKAVQR
ncbi:MAG: hypothetical protein ACYTAS_01125 [Planctomycetota bacterium]|jgi:hypothetical protein